MGCVHDYDSFSIGGLRVVEACRFLSLVFGSARFSPGPSTESNRPESERSIISL
jgi:hypothetical protein